MWSRKAMAAGRSLADDDGGRRLSATERRSGHAVAWAACGIFSIAIGATQLGSLAHEIIDMDEATFIVMAKDMLNGNLPYVALIYWQADALPWLRLATIDVPLSYANLTLSEIGMRTLLNGWGFLLQNWREPHLFMPFTLATMVGLAVSVHDYRTSSSQRFQPAQGKPPVYTRHELEWLTLGAVMVTVPMTGTFHHYWLQIFPICAVHWKSGPPIRPRRGLRRC